MILSKERRWLMLFAVIILLVTTIPYFLGYAFEDENWRFTGFIVGVEDGNSYIAKMLSGAAGDWLFRTPYSIVPQQGVLAFLPYILLGKLATVPGQHEQLVVLFHTFRWIGGLLYIWASYDFLSLFIDEVRYRRLGVALAAVGGGLGGGIILGIENLWLNNLPLEFYSPETFGFISILSLPHLSVARALLLWGLCIYLKPANPARKNIAGVWGGLLWLLLGFFQPLTIVSGWTVLFCHLLILFCFWAWQILRHETGPRVNIAFFTRRAVSMVVVSSPMVAYNFFAFQLDPFLIGWKSQNLILSPPPVDYLLAYGLILAFSLFGAIRVFKFRQQTGFLLLGWILALPALIYAPYNLQRRLPEGVWTAWIALAFIGIGAGGHLWRRLKNVLYLGFLPAIILYASLLQGVGAVEQGVYRPVNEILIFKEILLDAAPADIAVTAYSTGNALPAWAPLRVVIGHGPESVLYSSYQEQVRSFYCGDITQDEAWDWILENQIKYIIAGPEEAALCRNNIRVYPDNLSWMDAWKTFGDYSVYKVSCQP